MTTAQYGFGTMRGNVAFEDAVRRVTDALRNEGFGVLTEIDVPRLHPVIHAVAEKESVV